MLPHDLRVSGRGDELSRAAGTTSFRSRDQGESVHDCSDRSCRRPSPVICHGHDVQSTIENNSGTYFPLVFSCQHKPVILHPLSLEQGSCRAAAEQQWRMSCRGIVPHSPSLIKKHIHCRRVLTLRLATRVWNSTPR